LQGAFSKTRLTNWCEALSICVLRGSRHRFSREEIDFIGDGKVAAAMAGIQAKLQKTVYLKESQPRAPLIS